MFRVPLGLPKTIRGSASGDARLHERSRLREKGLPFITHLLWLPAMVGLAATVLTAWYGTL